MADELFKSEVPEFDASGYDSILQSISAGQREETGGDAFRNILSRSLEGIYAGMGGDPRLTPTYQAREYERARKEEDRKFSRELKVKLADAGLKARSENQEALRKQKEDNEALLGYMANASGLPLPQLESELSATSTMESAKGVLKLDPSSFGSASGEIKSVQKALGSVINSSEYDDASKQEAIDQLLDKANSLADLHYTPPPTEEQVVDGMRQQFNSSTYSIGNGAYAVRNEDGTFRIQHNNGELSQIEREDNQYYEQKKSRVDFAVRQRQFSDFAASNPISSYAEKFQDQVGAANFQKINSRIPASKLQKFYSILQENDFSQRSYKLDTRTPQDRYLNEFTDKERIERIKDARYQIARERDEFSFDQLSEQAKAQEASSVPNRDVMERVYSNIQEETDIFNDSVTASKSQSLSLRKSSWMKLIGSDPELSSQLVKNPYRIESDKLAAEAIKLIDRQKKARLGKEERRQVASKINVEVSRLKNAFQSQGNDSDYYLWDEDGNPILKDSLDESQNVISYLADQADKPQPQAVDEISEAMEPAAAFVPETEEQKVTAENLQNMALMREFTDRPAVQEAAEALIDSKQSVSKPEAIIKLSQKLDPRVVQLKIDAGMSPSDAMDSIYKGFSTAAKGKGVNFYNLSQEDRNDIIKEGTWGTGDEKEDQKKWDSLNEGDIFVAADGSTLVKGRVDQTMFEAAGEKVGLGKTTSGLVDLAVDTGSLVGEFGSDLAGAYNAPVGGRIRGAALAELGARSLYGSSAGKIVGALSGETPKRLFNVAKKATEDFPTSIKDVSSAAKLLDATARMRFRGAESEVSGMIRDALNEVETSAIGIFDAFRGTDLGKDLEPLFVSLVDAYVENKPDKAAQIESAIINKASQPKERVEKAPDGIVDSLMRMVDEGSYFGRALKSEIGKAIDEIKGPERAEATPSSGMGGTKEYARRYFEKLKKDYSEASEIINDIASTEGSGAKPSRERSAVAENARYFAKAFESEYTKQNQASARDKRKRELNTQITLLASQAKRDDPLAKRKLDEARKELARIEKFESIINKTTQR
jgi:hypothetical protein